MARSRTALLAASARRVAALTRSAPTGAQHARPVQAPAALTGPRAQHSAGAATPAVASRGPRPDFVRVFDGVGGELACLQCAAPAVL